MSSVTVGFDSQGRAIHRLREQVPLRFIHPPSRAPTPRRTREVLVDIGDDGIITTGRTTMLRARADLTHTLEDVPLVGADNSYIGTSGMVGVPEELFARRARGGPDKTHVLLEAGVPAAAKPKTPFPASFPDMRGEGVRRYQDEDETFADEGAEHEDGEGEDEALRLREGEDSEPEDEDDALARLCQEVAEFVHDGSKGLALVASALRRRRRSALAAGGELD